jgi:cyclic beta-1,2-glucan synthetase
MNTSGSLMQEVANLAKRHAFTNKPARFVPVWAKIDLMSQWLLSACQAASEPQSDTTRAAEWLLDNDYQVQRAVQQVKNDMPFGFYRRLPVLGDDQAAGSPRVFALAYDLLRASQLQLSSQTIIRFLNGYQEKVPLTTGELWAFPTMLRLACLEILVCAFSRLFPDVALPFVPSMQARVRIAFDDTECIARALANLGILSSIGWKDVFEAVSLVEASLRKDPAGVYAQMDFETRDRYRRAVEDLAAGSSQPEVDVAEAALQCALSPGLPDRHVGHCLVGSSRRDLELTLGYRASPSLMLARLWLRHAWSISCLMLGFVTLGALILPGAYLAAKGGGLALWLLGIGLVLLPASMVAVTVVHWLITMVVPPRLLPKLDFQKGIPADCATAVVMPVLVSQAQEVAALVERMELHRISNPDPLLQFVLLSDHADAPFERLAADAGIEQVLVDGIRKLNAHYGSKGSGPFHLLHRPRRHNPRQGCWMGWERKRGKLAEFNRFVLGEQVSDFGLWEGNPERLRGIRFVVSVDADTRLPHDSVARLVGTLAHPLNRARIDPQTGCVQSGYTVVQPRIEIAPENGSQSLFARFFAGDTAIDIYSRAVSEVYQDLFGSGTYAGKGIYEVDPFHRSIDRFMPENAVLSHDMLEGAHGRTALASDIVLYESFPTGYVEYSRRWHRWVRGDWQLLPWVAAQGTEMPRRRLAALDRWKLVDNLRRSLIPCSLVALASAGWLVLPGSAWVWSLMTILVPTAGIFTNGIWVLARARHRSAMHGSLRQAADQFGRWLLTLVFLVQDAAVALDAIIRTLWRLFVSHENLLEWTSSASMAMHFNGQNTRAEIWRQMGVGPVYSIAMAGAVAVLNPDALPAAAPLLLLWLASPEIAAFISRPREERAGRLDGGERLYLRRLARRTWLFFETFAGPEDNWLPPDNVQEEPHSEVAHRTSPTNAGMMLLSSLTAWDLGYIGSNELAVRAKNVLDTLGRLQQYRGHILNWYDTRSLEPLEPRYISTVDSGNLAACLVALKEGCLDAVRAAAIRNAQWNGLIDELGLLSRSMEMVSSRQSAEFIAILDLMSGQIQTAHNDPEAAFGLLNSLLDDSYPKLASSVRDAFASFGNAGTDDLREVNVWLERVFHHLAGRRREFEALRPWEALLAKPPDNFAALARNIGKMVPAGTPVNSIASGCAQARELLGALTFPADDTARYWIRDLDASLERGTQAQDSLCKTLIKIADKAGELANAMDFRFLYDTQARLFHIGYNLSADRIDRNHYDLLASEARLTSFFAIAKGDVPAEHWFYLGRPITQTAAGPALISWNGSMFEYLMPPLLMGSHPGTLLGQSERAAVKYQWSYAKRLKMPWGMSESAFSARDPSESYRYRAFGVPGLGRRRGLSRDMVVAPYASALTLGISPRIAVQNLRELERLGAGSRFGLREALDFTPERVDPGRRFTLIRSYMAHHQGMLLSAVGNVLADNILVRRFRADPRIRANELLLYERIPRELAPEVTRPAEVQKPTTPSAKVPVPGPWQPATLDLFPQVHPLGNGRFASWISEAGAGRLCWNGYALTRWLPDATCDDHGLWLYVRDDDTGAVWSIGRQPTGVEAAERSVIFHPHMAEFHRRDHDISIRMEVAVAARDDIEIRRFTVINQSTRERALSLTSLGEVVLAPPLEDERHPAFSKLFVGSEHLPELEGLLFTRRHRRPEENSPVMLHRLVSDNPSVSVVALDCDRRSVLGRNGSMRLPRGLIDGLKGKTGWTLDTAMALQLELSLAPNGRCQFALITIAANSRRSVLEIAQRYTTLDSLNWALEDAASEAAHEAHELGIEPDRLPELQVLVSLLLHPSTVLRAAPEAIATNLLGQPRLWAMGLSGDHPIVVLRLTDPKKTDLVHLLVRAHRLWQRRNILIDLVLLRTGASGYEDPIREEVYEALREAGAQESLAQNAGIHLIFADQISEDDCRLVEATARVVLDADHRTLGEQLAAAMHGRSEPSLFAPSGRKDFKEHTPALVRPGDLLFDNGIGGFAPDGREYVIHLEPGVSTPAPWSNAIANDGFGSIVTEAGLGFTWALNSGENRLTPWNNDPVADPPSEVLYLRDEETAAIWTPTPWPTPDSSASQIRHGAGYTKWLKSSHGLEQELLVFVPPDDPVKIIRLKLRNHGSQTRRLTATYYAEWILGALKSVSRPTVVCNYDAGCHALLARNSWNPDFGERVAFLTSNLPPHSLSNDRMAFLGREGDHSHPAAISHRDLGGNLLPSADPCAAFQVRLEIEAGDMKVVVFVLGQGDNHAHARALVRRWQDPGRAETAFAELNHRWDERLGAISVKTPDPSFDLMVNRWLPYQVLASRLMSRAGFYQAGGAFGFRDQLQDVLALLHSDPGRARAHILASAARQFEEGDVMHWWHPPSDRGVRTRCSDDLLWLPYVTGSYVEATGDVSILREEVPYLRAPPLTDVETDRYAQFEVTTECHSLFEHCERAIERGVIEGANGLPLIGAGDWNDGMDRVGRGMRGESVWLAWFAIAVMKKFAALSARLGHDETRARWTDRADRLAHAVDTAGWDGNWYRRAFDDDGIAWGSASNDECRIDIIAQAWAVISGAAPEVRARMAIESAAAELMREDDGIIRLLWPPFDKTPRDPGYIKAYPPGIRENGGQYTHGATWLGFAFAALGEGTKAGRVFAMINPINHSSTFSDIERYLVEPYVVAADVAGVEPHVGRGGWTWYTGSAAWTWRLGVEAILGLRFKEGQLVIDPCLPDDWKFFEAHVKGPAGSLCVRVENPEGVSKGPLEVTVDNAPLEGSAITFPTDGRLHQVLVRIGRPHCP